MRLRILKEGLSDLLPEFWPRWSVRFVLNHTLAKLDEMQKFRRSAFRWNSNPSELGVSPGKAHREGAEGDPGYNLLAHALTFKVAVLWQPTSTREN